MIYYTIYRTTNLLNGKIYVGKHQTGDPQDGYLGSGRAIKSAIKKYGRENFSKEVLYIFDTEEDMNSKEREIITENFVRDANTYNIGVGGEGGPHFLGKTHSDETKALLAEKSSGRKLPLEAVEKIRISNFGRTVSLETKKKISDKAKLRYQNEGVGKQINEGVGKQINEGIRKKISASMKAYHEANTVIPYERTSEHKNKLSQKMREVYSNKKMCWVKNEEIKHSVRIDISELEKYTELGYVRGRKITAG
jgi:group I intron endonuclease